MRQGGISPRGAAVPLLLGVVLGVAGALLAATEASVWRPLGVANADRIVHLGGLAHPPMGEPAAYWGAASGLQALASYETGLMEVKSGARLGEARVTAVSAGFFGVFATSPSRGRPFSAEEGRVALAVAIVSDTFAARAFGPGTPALGETITIDGIAHQVVGVGPAGFDFPGATDVWTPGSSTRLGVRWRDDPFGLVRSDGWVGRLREGVSAESLQAELGGMLRQLHVLYTAKTGLRFGDQVNVRPVRDIVRERVIGPLLALLAATAVLLAAVAGSLGTLLFGTLSERRGELAVRQALGATRWDIFGHLTLETLHLGLRTGLTAAVIAGIAVLAGRQAFAGWWVHQPAVGHLLGVAALAGFGLAATITALAALGPTLDALSAAPAESLRDTSVARHPRAVRARRALVVAQAAIAVVLLNGALASALSLEALVDSPQGYEPKRLLVARREASALGGEFIETVKALPGVAAAGAASALPGAKAAGGVWLEFDGATAFCQVWHVEGEFFAAAGIGKVSGRAFLAGEDHVLVVGAGSIGRADTELPREGSQVRLNGESVLRQIVGVVGRVRAADGSDEGPAQCYVPARRPSTARPGGGAPWLLVRCDDCSAARRALEPHPVSGVVPAAELMARARAPLLARVRLLAVYALVGLSIALAGAWAIVYSLSAMRRSELAVRSALGARPSDLVAAMAAEGVALAALGAGLGTLLSVWLGQAAQSAFFRWTQFEVVALPSSALLTVVAASLAALLPARHASRQSPWDALRRP